MLRKIFNLWKKFGLFIATVIGTILSTILYIFIITPFGIFVNLFTDYLNIKGVKKSTWIDRSPKDLTLKEMKRQY